MEYQKIKNLLGNTPDKVPRFINKKWTEVHNQTGETYNTNKQIRFKTSMLRSDLCDFSDAYIVVKGIVTVSVDERDRDEMNRQVILKNNARFVSCISKTNGVLVENAEDLDIVMTVYILLEYSKNYSKTSASLWNYYRDQLTFETNDNNGPNENVINSKSFKYKTSMTSTKTSKTSTYNFPRRIIDADGISVNNPNYGRNNRSTKHVKFAVPLKHLGNFQNSLNLRIINCEVSLNLSWCKTCVITSMEKRTVRAAQGGNPAIYGDSAESAVLKIKDCKLYVPVVTLSSENDKILLEQLKTGVKRTSKWNKYRSEKSNQTKNNKSNYLIDPTLTNLKRLFGLTFENEDDRTSFSKYYVPRVEINDFNVLVDGKPFFKFL